MIYAGKTGNKYKFYEVTGPQGKKLTLSNITTVHNGSYKIGDILHAK